MSSVTNKKTPVEWVTSDRITHPDCEPIRSFWVSPEGPVTTRMLWNCPKRVDPAGQSKPIPKPPGQEWVISKEKSSKDCVPQQTMHIPRKGHMKATVLWKCPKAEKVPLPQNPEGPKFVRERMPTF